MGRQSSACRTGDTGAYTQKEGESDEKPQRKSVLKESFSEKKIDKEAASLPEGLRGKLVVIYIGNVRKDE